MTLRDAVGERVHARVGSVLRGKWRLDEVIGVGGMASVFAATHRNQSRVAIKMLHPEVALNAEVTARFLREGYVANAVGHPGTVSVLDDDVAEDGAPFLVMELLEGETLDALVNRAGPRSFAEAAELVEQLLDVLAAAHQRQIVHRDIKPENLFLTHAGRVKVLDFGIARLRELTSSSAGGTSAGSVLGTPPFMAPEQALGHWDDVDGRSDLWAAGATLYTLVSGRYVHEADTLQGQLVLAATRRARPLAEVVLNAPAEFSAVVDRALAFDREMRFPDARSMQVALRAASSGGSGRPITLGQRREAGIAQNPTVVAPDTSPGRDGSRGTFATAQAVSRSAAEPPRPSPVFGYGLAAAACVLVGIAVFVVRGWNTHPPSVPTAGRTLGVPTSAVGSGAVPLRPSEEPAPMLAPEAITPAPPSAKAPTRHPTPAKSTPKGATVVMPVPHASAPEANPAKPPPIETGTKSSLMGDPFDRRH
jgi:serine/threonine-protein kinase